MSKRVFPAVALAALAASPALAQLPAGDWRLRFADEFHGTALDYDKWGANYPWGSQHNHAAYMDPGQIKVGNGVMNLQAIAQRHPNSTNSHHDQFGWLDRRYTSAAVHTADTLRLDAGYVEARLKVPNQLGTWAAFWMLREGWPPEIDILETPLWNADQKHRYHTYYHYGPDWQNHYSFGESNDVGVDLTAGFHNFGMEWSNTRMSFFFDGQLQYTSTNAQAIAQAKNMYLILNHAVGGWPGYPPDDSTFPANYEVDWVRVWERPQAETSTWTRAGNGYQNWDDVAHWSNAVAPRQGEQTAVLGVLAGTANQHLDWGHTKTLGNLTIRSGTSYTVGFADDQLMFSDWQGSVLDVQVEPSAAAQGTHTMASRVQLHTDLRVRNATANALTFSAEVHGQGRLFVDSGTARFTGPVRPAGGLVVGGVAGATAVALLNGPTVEVSALVVGDVGNGTVRQTTGNVTVTTGELWVGQGVNGVGSYEQTGGTVAVNNWLAVGRDRATGTYTLTNGTLTKAGAGNLILGSLGGTGTLVQNGGTVHVAAGNTLLGEDATAHGTYTLNGGAANLATLAVGQRNGGKGTFNLNGGTATVAAVTRNTAGNAGVGTFNFNGGTLRASADSPAFVANLTAANVLAGGARLDTQGFDVTVPQPLLAGPNSTGGLTKLGAGTLTLTGANTYAGNTVVGAGKLVAGHKSALGTGGATVNGFATLRLAPTLTEAVSVRSLVLATLGKIEVNDAGLVVDYAATSPLDPLVAAMAHGALVSLRGATDARYAVGYAEASALGASTYAGAALDATAFVIDTALRGDLDLDGTVGFADLAALAAHYGQAEGATWRDGDVTYDRAVTFADLSAVAGNYGAGPLTAPQRATLGEGFVADWALAVAAVPEPGVALLVAVVAPLALRRR